MDTTAAVKCFLRMAELRRPDAVAEERLEYCSFEFGISSGNQSQHMILDKHEWFSHIDFRLQYFQKRDQKSRLCAGRINVHFGSEIDCQVIMIYNTDNFDFLCSGRTCWCSNQAQNSQENTETIIYILSLENI